MREYRIVGTPPPSMTPEKIEAIKALVDQLGAACNGNSLDVGLSALLSTYVTLSDQNGRLVQSAEQMGAQARALLRIAAAREAPSAAGVSTDDVAAVNAHDISRRSDALATAILAEPRLAHEHGSVIANALMGAYLSTIASAPQEVLPSAIAALETTLEGLREMQQLPGMQRH